MLKMVEWLGKIIAAGLIISFLSIWTTGYIVNSYVESLLKQYELPLEVQPFALSGLWGKMWGADPMVAAVDGADATVDDGASDGEHLQASANAGEPRDGQGQGATGQNGGGVTGQNNQGSSGQAENGQGVDGLGAGAPDGDEPGGASGANERGATETGTDDAELDDLETQPPHSTVTGSGSGAKAESGASGVPSSGVNDGQAGGSGTPGPGDDEAAVPVWNSKDALTTEELSDVKNQMDAEDRQKLFQLLVSKLPSEGWQRLSVLMEDGLTEEELREAEQIMAKHLSTEEYDQLMEILKKY
ncbi:hypothetical protein EBB07_05535 [Paenibacillaceae bacterium]|nr:hypothetical protein EBB07_05535 [Paenibacillaceae bacterium]